MLSEILFWSHLSIGLLTGVFIFLLCLTGAILAPDSDILKSRATDVKRVIAHYDYTRLYYSQFFWVDAAWERLQTLK